MITKKPSLRGHRLFTRVDINGHRGIQLSPRDVEILKLCFEHRFLDSDQLKALLSATTVAQKQYLKVRLQQLWQQGYLERPKDQLILRVREQYRPLIYALGHKGIAPLAERTGRDIAHIRWTQKHDQIQAPYLKHALMISEFFTSLTLALRPRPGWALTDWRQGKSIFETVTVDRKPVSLRPDGFLVLTETPSNGPPKPHYYLLEADLGTVREKTMFDRYRRYWAYWKRIKDEERLERGQLARQKPFVSGRTLPIHKAFRVLTVCTNATRTENLRQLARQADDAACGSTMFHFTHQQWSLTNPAPIVEPIWTTPATGERRAIV